MNTWRRGWALAFAVLLLAAPSARAAEGDEEGRELKWFGSLRVRQGCVPKSHSNG